MIKMVFYTGGIKCLVLLVNRYLCGSHYDLRYVGIPYFPFIFFCKKKKKEEIQVRISTKIILQQILL